MAALAGVCTSNKCEFFSCARCHCCGQDLCPDHIKEHKDQLNFKLIPLTDEINVLSSGLEHFALNLDELEKWRVEAHQTIEDFCQRKRQVLLDERKRKSREELQQIQSSVVLLLQRQGATHENIEALTKSIDSIRQQLNELRKVRLILTPLEIDNDMILLSTAEPEQATAG
jgi:predicted  nucleic acid-binding Zn-ribbon protein